ncbi:MAG: hypothetical protein HC897_01720, partial [Thermoanaerobaculia bacterium]|nr:hypothetical protein [Thermoanaerobaculia bacterium]
HAQPPFRQELLPGLAGFDLGGRSTPAFADLDGDGDLDVVVGQSAGMLNYLVNTGSSSVPVYVEVTGTRNPFGAFDVGLSSAPALADLDGDGDVDAVVGAADGHLALLPQHRQRHRTRFSRAHRHRQSVRGFRRRQRQRPRARRPRRRWRSRRRRRCFGCPRGAVSKHRQLERPRLRRGDRQRKSFLWL